MINKKNNNNNNSSILVIIPNYSHGKLKAGYEYVFPLGLAYIVSSLQEAKLKVKVINCNHIDGSTSDILRDTLNEEYYSIVCTGGTSMIFNELKEIISIASEHKSQPTTVFGGIIVTSEPDVVFEAIRPDYAIVGEGEDSATKLFSQLMLGKRPETIPGSIFKKDGVTVKRPVSDKLKDIDTIPFPALEMLGYSQWLDNQPSSGLSNASRSYPILGSRGCPFKCTFCYHFEKHRQRSLDSIFRPYTKRF